MSDLLQKTRECLKTGYYPKWSTYVELRVKDIDAYFDPKRLADAIASIESYCAKHDRPLVPGSRQRLRLLHRR